MPSRKGRWHVPPCPLCVRWTCGSCGETKTNLCSVFSYPKCVKCGSTDGSSVHAHHYDPELRAEHAQLYRRSTRVLITDHMRIRNLWALRDRLKGIIADFDVQSRQANHTATGSPENNLAVNRGNDQLLALEALIRDWVKNHPEEL